MLRLFFFAALLGLTACNSGGFTLWGTHHDPKYGPHNFAFFNQDRDLRTVVQGNPFPTENQQMVAEKVAASMRGRNAFGYTHFTTTPDETANPNTSLVVRFNPTHGYTGARLCSDPSPAPALANPGGEVTMVMSYCLRETALAWIRGGTALPASPDDPVFQEMMGNAMQNLIPFRNPFFPGGEGNCQTNNC